MFMASEHVGPRLSHRCKFCITNTNCTDYSANMVCNAYAHTTVILFAIVNVTIDDSPFAASILRLIIGRHNVPPYRCKYKPNYLTRVRQPYGHYHNAQNGSCWKATKYSPRHETVIQHLERYNRLLPPIMCVHVTDESAGGLDSRQCVHGTTADEKRKQRTYRRYPLHGYTVNIAR